MRRLPGALWAVLDHKWLARVSNAAGIVGAALAVEKWATRHLRGWDSATVVIVSLLVIGLLGRVAAGYASHRRRRAAVGQNPQSALSVLVRNLWFASPENHMRALAAELVVTNQSAQDRMSVMVSFDLPLEDGRRIHTDPLPPGFIADSHPMIGALALVPTPFTLEPQASFRGWFAAPTDHPRLHPAQGARVVLRDLVSGATAVAEL